MKKVAFSLFLLFVFATSCTDRDDDLTAVNIRIKNSSALTFDRVVVESEDHIYENIGADSFSDYQEYETAYSFNYIEITSGEETYVLQPIDFVGEEELPIGLYTYDLQIDQEGQVSLEFRID